MADQADTITIDKVLTIDEVAAYFKVSKRTIEDWRKTLTFPKPLDLPGRSLRWNRQQIDDYLQEMTR